MSEDNNRAHGIQQQPHNKPLLTVPEQIAHLRSKGVTFTLCTEADAARHLHEKCQFFRIYSYRGLFDKCVGGERNGQYANLDFAHLKELSNIDRRLRDVLLPMTLDVEHFTKVRLLAAAEDNGENGHTVMQDYFESLSQGQHSHIKNELNKRTEDPYSGTLIHKYLGNMPLWVFCEVVPFGTFLGILKYCAGRWNDRELNEVHYLLKHVRSLRNGCAHGACMLNDLFADAVPMRPPVPLLKALANCDIPKRARAKWLKSPRMVQICSLIYLFGTIVPDGLLRDDRKEAIHSFAKAVDEALPLFDEQNPAVAALSFVERLTRGVGLLK